MQAPCAPHLQAVKRIFRYLKGTINLGLHFTKSPLSALQGYCDADWAGSVDDRRSISKFAIYMWSNSLSWGAKKQTTVARSIAEVEYRSLASTTAKILWFINLLTHLRYKLLAPILHSDNISAISMARNQVFHQRTKHIEIDIHFIREEVANGLINFAHILGQEQVADVFIKPLCSPRFVYNRDKLYIVTIPTWPWRGMIG